MSEQHAFFGTIALSVVNAVRLGLQLLVLPILARILGPDAFGLVGLAIPIVLLAAILCDGGMGNALVRHPSPSWQLESTVFWLSLGTGIALTILLGLVSVPIAAMFSQPSLAPVLAALSFILTLGGALVVPNARITRSRNFAIFAVGDLLSLILSAAAGIYAALHGFGVWSLVIQQLLLWLTKALWLFPISNFKPSFFCKPSLAKPFLHFGLNSVAASIADFLGKSVPSLVVGGALGVTALGHFSMAYQLTRVPEMVISGPIYLSTFTALARTVDRNLAGALVLRSLRMIILALALLFGGLYLTADLATDLLLGAKWAETAPVLAALAPMGFCLCLYSFMGAVLLGLGNSGRQFKLTLLCSVAMVIGSAAGTRFGVTAVAAGLSLGAAALAPFYFQALAGELRLPVPAVWSAAGAALVATVVMACVILVVRSEITHLNEGLQLVMAVAAGTLSFICTIAILVGRKFLDDARSFHPGGRSEAQRLVESEQEMAFSFEGAALAERGKE
jgi:O-antigen/teichoic acid export membrane protein